MKTLDLWIASALLLLASGCNHSGPGSVSHGPVLAEQMTREELVTLNRALIATGKGNVPVNGGKVISRLAATLQSHDKERFLLAVAALGSFGPNAEGAVPALAESLSTADPSAKVLVVRTLAKIGPPARQAIPVLRKLSASHDPALRAVCQDALRSISN